MFGLDQLLDSLMGNPQVSSPVGRDDAAETAALMARLQERMPTLERGQAWLTQARSDTPFLTHHRADVLATVPALRVGATSAWIGLMDEPHWDPELGSDALVRLLAAMMAWQVAASQRALTRLEIEASELHAVVWLPLVGETERYLVDQTATEAILKAFREQTDQVGPLVDVGVAAPEAGEDATRLVEETQRWCRLEDQAAAADVLASQWRIMDVAAIGVWYRAFGEQLQAHDAG